MKKLITVLSLAMFINASIGFASDSNVEVKALITKQEKKLAADRKELEALLKGVQELKANVAEARDSRETAPKISIPVILVGAGLLGTGIVMTRSKQPMPFAFGMVFGIAGTVTIVGGSIYFYVKYSQLKRLEDALEKKEASLQQLLQQVALDEMQLAELRMQLETEAGE